MVRVNNKLDGEHEHEQWDYGPGGWQSEFAVATDQAEQGGHEAGVRPLRGDLVHGYLPGQGLSICESKLYLISR